MLFLHDQESPVDPILCNLTLYENDVRPSAGFLSFCSYFIMAQFLPCLGVNI